MDRSVPESYLQECAIGNKGRLSLGLYNICMPGSDREQTPTHATSTMENGCTS